MCCLLPVSPAKVSLSVLFGDDGMGEGQSPAFPGESAGTFEEFLAGFCRRCIPCVANGYGDPLALRLGRASRKKRMLSPTSCTGGVDLMRFLPSLADWLQLLRLSHLNHMVEFVLRSGAGESVDCWARPLKIGE